MSAAEDLAEGLLQLKIELDPTSQQQLLEYLALLQKWNKVYNLTAIRDPRQMVGNHLLDSLSVLPYLWQGHWLDVGCGAGLPGVVLAIAKPEWSFTLLDSNSKKTSFVQQATIELGLKNIEVLCKRIEEYAPTEKYDGIISRAFAETADFVLLTKHLIAKDGRWAAMKGLPERELKRLPQEIIVERVIELKVPKLEAARSLVILRENK